MAKPRKMMVAVLTIGLGFFWCLLRNSLVNANFVVVELFLRSWE